MENLHDKRKVYEKSQLLESEIKENPIEMFRDWFLQDRLHTLLIQCRVHASCFRS